MVEDKNWNRGRREEIGDVVVFGLNRFVATFSLDRLVGASAGIASLDLRLESPRLNFLSESSCWNLQSESSCWNRLVGIVLFGTRNKRQ